MAEIAVTEEKKGSSLPIVAVDIDDEKIPSTKTEVSAGEPAPKRDGDAADETEFPTGIKLFSIITSLFMAAFLVILDGTIISVAIPKITDEFHSLGDVGWYGSAFLLTRAAFTLLFGKIYTILSIKWVFIVSTGIFEIGSVVCGAAPTSTAFILGRAIAGLGSAGLFSGVMIIMVYTVPLRKRPIYQGIFGAMFGISNVVGPLLGGALTDGASWRWCFYINLPFGAVTIPVLVWILKIEQPPGAKDMTTREKFAKLDPIGVLFLFPGVICLLLALEWGGNEYPWSDARIITLLVLSGVLLVAFGFVQVWKGETATVPPRLMKQRTVVSGLFYGTVIGGAMMVMTYEIPLWFQGVKGASAVESGIRMFPMLLSTVLGVVIGSTLTFKTGYYTPQMIVSSVLSSIGAGLITTWKVDTDAAKWIGYQIIFGLGLGLGMQQPNMGIQTVLSKKDIPIGTAVLFFGLFIGGTLFLSITQTVFNNELTHNLKRIQGLDLTSALTVGATDLRHLVPAKFISQVLAAFNDALMNAIYVATATAAVSIIGALTMEWKSIKKGHGQGEKPKEESDTKEV